MQKAVRLLICNPATRVTTNSGVLSLSTPDGGVTMSVERTGSGPRFRARRNVASSDEVFYMETGDGLSVSDNFRALLAQIPAQVRHVSSDALLDHLLFRTCPAAGTYCAQIQRLGHGVRLEWEGHAPAQLSKPTRLTAATFTEPNDAISTALENSLRSATHHTSLLSGGVDSTLTHTYLPDGSDSVSATIDAREFRLEEEYALSAAKLLGSAHELVRVNEDSYLGLLITTIRRLGMPPHHLQTVLLDAALGSRHSAYVTSQMADALFGLGATEAALNPPKPLRRALRWVKARARSIRHAPIGHESLATQLARPPLDPLGFGNLFAVWSDLRALLGAFGEPAVRRRLEVRRDYVLQRVDAVDDDGPMGHLHIGHWIDFYCDDTVTIWRQLAHARGKELVAPFASEALAGAALGVPAFMRYSRNGRTKYLLKDLLSHRLPAYKVDKKKGSSGLPLQRFAVSGPLTGALERLDASPRVRELIEELKPQPGSQLHWNFLTLALWESHVLTDGSLTPPEGTRVINA